MDVRPGDSSKSVVNRFAVGFLIHLATKHKSELVSYNNRIPALIFVVSMTLIVGYLEKLVISINVPGLKLVKTFLHNVFIFWGTFNAYLLVATTEFLFVDTLSGEELTLDNLFRAIMLVLILATVLAILEFFSKEMDKEFKTETNKTT